MPPPSTSCGQSLRKKDKFRFAACMMIAVNQPCGRGGMADAEDLSKLECSPGNRRCRTAQSRGNLQWQARAKPGATSREGVETRRAAPNPRTVRETAKGYSR